MKPDPETGGLTVVAVPIGNLEDISLRAVAALRAADRIACEDTRVTGKLLSKLGLENRGQMLSYRDENEVQLADSLADSIEAGTRVTLVCDAGTPVVSDPGFRLVRECRRRGLPVSPCPGPSAAITALSISGLPSESFLFAGFLPAKRSARLRFFERYADFEFTLVLYESCHRITKCLEDIVACLGAARCVALSRELTKLHETSRTGPAAAVLEEKKKRSSKGEFVICIARDGFTL